MAQKKSTKAKEIQDPQQPWSKRILRAIRLCAMAVGGFLLAWVLIYRFIPIPATPYSIAERLRLGELQKEWVSIDEMSPKIAYAVVAAEDANFCLHWGFDMRAIRDAIAEGSNRGASTISQQTVKNAFLWQGRSWPRKALEALLTPLVELLWPKRRILEVYLNVAEFDTGVFGVEAAAQNYFGIGSDSLSTDEAALLAAILPDPKDRNAAKPTKYVRKRAQDIMDGALLIQKDGRADCFKD